MGDDFRQQRIEERRYVAAGFHPGINAQAFSVGRREHHFGEQARRRLELAARIFGVDARLDRVALRVQRGGDLRERRQIACGQFNHHAHQIDAPHLLGDAVFNLQTGVHFKEVKLPGVAVVDKFHRSGAAVTDCLTETDRRRAQRLRHAVGQIRRGGFFQHFLVAALDGTVTHTEGNHLARAVAKDLYFQVARALDVFFDKHACVAEVVFAEALDGIEGVSQFRRVVADPHPDPAAARRAF